MTPEENEIFLTHFKHIDTIQTVPLFALSLLEKNAALNNQKVKQTNTDAAIILTIGNVAYVAFPFS